MPIYGAPDIEVDYEYKALVSITAEQPIGSGIIVTYKPGDVFPGEEWGIAAHNLVEVGKAVRYATAVRQPTKLHLVEELLEAHGDVLANESNAAVTSYPMAMGRGWYTLSDGSRIRNKEQAFETQSILDRKGGSE